MIIPKKIIARILFVRIKERLFLDWWSSQLNSGWTLPGVHLIAEMWQDTTNRCCDEQCSQQSMQWMYQNYFIWYFAKSNINHFMFIEKSNIRKPWPRGILRSLLFKTISKTAWWFQPSPEAHNTNRLQGLFFLLIFNVPNGHPHPNGTGPGQRWPPENSQHVFNKPYHTWWYIWRFPEIEVPLDHAV